MPYAVLYGSLLAEDWSVFYCNLLAEELSNVLL